VDVEAGDRAVELMRQSGSIAAGDLLGALGGFGAALAMPEGMVEPVLVSATDGVGTKLELARELDLLDGVGRDLVAMCADDVVCHGARPWFFLDYLAVGRVVPERVARIVAGIADGCADAGCALVGGETAEHPGTMPDDAFDLAGFCVGVVDRTRLIDGRDARPGDAVVGIESSGLHANGFSLVRQLVARNGLDLRAPHPALDEASTLGEILLRPTRIYARAVLGLREQLDRAGLRLSGVAHITGGGLSGNLPRAVPQGLGVRLDPSAWPLPPVLVLLAELGRLSGTEMRAIFNCGIGMAVVVEGVAADPAIDWLAGLGLPAWQIGQVIEGRDAGPGRYMESAA
jgi:phosphoribosylformylglycinamidine cyclo-ligase